MGKRVIAREDYMVAYDDMVKLLKKHAHKMSSLEMLAVAANMNGKLLAMQDQRSISPAEALKCIGENIEIGNNEAVKALQKSQGKT